MIGLEEPALTAKCYKVPGTETNRGLEGAKSDAERMDALSKNLY